MKSVVLVCLLVLTGCASDSNDKATRDVEHVEKSVKRGVDKIVHSPATKELANDAKRGFNKADEAVTKQLRKGREKVREKLNGDSK